MCVICIHFLAKIILLGAYRWKTIAGAQ
uniref:Uncharacterized protein n=1 Tax=Arundo donax TaxID=35708 RepID=A0A0A9F3U5_ARUDO